MGFRLKTIDGWFSVFSKLLCSIYFLCGCIGNNKNRIEDEEINRKYVTDSAVVVKLKNPQNGYFISFVHTEEKDVIHLIKGDSISLTLDTERLPLFLCEYEDSICGEYVTDINIPVVKLDTLDIIKYNLPDIIFMDVNFDGKEDFIFGLEGNGKLLYDCYDIENTIAEGKSSVLIKPMREEPYCRFASGAKYTIQDCTVFDHQKKEIFIYTTSGCCEYTDTWAKYYEGSKHENKSCVKVVKQERHVFIENNKETIEKYMLHGDSLRLVSVDERNI